MNKSILMEPILETLKYHLITLILLTFTGCHENSRRYNASILDLSFDSKVTSDSTLYFSLLSKKVTYIPLETRDEKILGEINAVYLNDGAIYVSDGNSVFIFDKAGKYIRDISCRGQGPGEYIHVNGFSVDSRGGVWVLSRSNRKLLYYNAEGKYQKEFSTDIFINRFSLLSDSVMITYSGYEKTDGGRIFLWEAGHKIKTYLPRAKNLNQFMNWVSPDNFYKKGDQILFSETFNDTVYAFHPDLSMSIQFVRHLAGSFPDLYERNFENGIAFLDVLKNKGYFYWQAPIFAGDRFLLFRYNKIGKSFLAYKSFERPQASRTFTHIEDDLYFKDLQIPFDVEGSIFSPQENLMIFSIPAYQMLTYLKTHPEFRSKTNGWNLTEESNPVLFILHCE